MKYDLAFLMCCCKSFLGSDNDDYTEEYIDNPNPNSTGTSGLQGQQQQVLQKQQQILIRTSNNYYDLLQVSKDATIDEIKRAYKKQSLLMHPDKLAQRGLQVTAIEQGKFTKMKEAYEVLSDSTRRELYDAIGAKGMKWIDEPFSIDPQELAHNFAKSSIVDRSKIFAIFVCIAIAVLLQPILICVHIDRTYKGTHLNSSWVATLIPLWIWNIILILYHTRVIMMGPIQKPDHIPDNEWIDPLPMKKRIFSMQRFLLIVLFELLVSLKLDNVISNKVPWYIIFIPLYLWEISTLYKKYPLARMRIVTIEDLEIALGKSFVEFTQAEKELIGQRYSVVSSTTGVDFDTASKLKTRARHDIIKCCFRLLFILLLLVQLDLHKEWNWWFIFCPFWIMTLLICYANYLSFADVQRMAAEKDPTLFGPTNNVTAATNKHQQQQSTTTTTSGTTNDVETGTDKNNTNTNTSSFNYGSLGDNNNINNDSNNNNNFMNYFGTKAATTTTTTTTGAQTSVPTPTPVPTATPLTEEEREELKAQVMASSSRLCSKCCFQGFILFIFFLFVAKLNGAGFSSFLIISPFLLIAGLILCCLGCAIFGVTEVPTDGIDFENSHFDYTNVEQQGAGLKPEQQQQRSSTTSAATTTTTTTPTHYPVSQLSPTSNPSSPIIIAPPEVAATSSSQMASTTTQAIVTPIPRAASTVSESRSDIVITSSDVISSSTGNAPALFSVLERDTSTSTIDIGNKESSTNNNSIPTSPFNNTIDSTTSTTGSAMKSSFRADDSGEIAGAVLDLD